MKFRTLLLSLLLACALPVGAPAEAGYCDTVSDPNLILCEDFEAPPLVADVGFGSGAPDFGPWYDHSGSAWACLRGANSYWTRKYGDGVLGMLWSPGQPASPTVGCACDAGGLRCMNGAWHPTDLWQANGFAGIAMLRAGEFDDEIPGFAGPTLAGVPHVFGTTVLGHRIRAGAVQGILGEPSLGGARRTFGVTMAVAYPPNVVASGIMNSAWKHNEWRTSGGSPAAADGIFLFHNVTNVALFPFEMPWRWEPPAQRAACLSAVAGATIRRGSITCGPDEAFGYLFLYADPTYYQRAVDLRPTGSGGWPWGTWGCARAQFTNLGLANASVRYWFQGPNDTAEVLVIDIDNWNQTGLSAQYGYGSMVWNAYANTNQAGGTPTTQTTFRYEDNLHITAGPPVSCAAIGFSGSPPPPLTPPAAPTGLTVQ